VLFCECFAVPFDSYWLRCFNGVHWDGVVAVIDILVYRRNRRVVIQSIVSCKSEARRCFGVMSNLPHAAELSLVPGILSIVLAFD
jgi:hypothetical protein